MPSLIDFRNVAALAPRPKKDKSAGAFLSENFGTIMSSINAFEDNKLQREKFNLEKEQFEDEKEREELLKSTLKSVLGGGTSSEDSDFIMGEEGLAGRLQESGAITFPLDQSTIGTPNDVKKESQLNIRTAGEALIKTGNPDLVKLGADFVRIGQTDAQIGLDTSEHMTKSLKVAGAFLDGLDPESAKQKAEQLGLEKMLGMPAGTLSSTENIRALQTLTRNFNKNNSNVVSVIKGRNPDSQQEQYFAVMSDNTTVPLPVNTEMSEFNRDFIINKYADALVIEGYTPEQVKNMTDEELAKAAQSGTLKKMAPGDVAFMYLMSDKENRDKIAANMSGGTPDGEPAAPSETGLTGEIKIHGHSNATSDLPFGALPDISFGGVKPDTLEGKTLLMEAANKDGLDFDGDPQEAVKAINKRIKETSNPTAKAELNAIKSLLILKAAKENK